MARRAIDWEAGAEWAQAVRCVFKEPVSKFNSHWRILLLSKPGNSMGSPASQRPDAQSGAYSFTIRMKRKASRADE